MRYEKFVINILLEKFSMTVGTKRKGVHIGLNVNMDTCPNVTGLTNPYFVLTITSVP